MAEEKAAKEEKKKEIVKKVEEAAKAEMKKAESKIENIKVFNIPLRKAFEKRRKQRAPYATRLIRRFLKMHLKADDVKLGRHLNEKIWERSIEKPPRKVSVGITRVDGQYRAELIGFAYEEFKPIAAKKPEGIAEKLTSRLGGKALKKQEEENLVEGKAAEKQ